MSSCFPFIKQKRKNNKEICLIILGLDNAGKTTILRTMKGISSDLVTPTLGFDKSEFCINRYNINVYDLGGNLSIRDIWEHYFAEIYGVIFVVDCTDSSRFIECREVFHKLLAHELINKRDMDSAVEESKIVRSLKLNDIVNKYKCPCHLERCSALLQSDNKLDKGIKDGFKWLLAYIDLEYAILKTRIDANMLQQCQKLTLNIEKRREKIQLEKIKKQEKLFFNDDNIITNIKPEGDINIESSMNTLNETNSDDDNKGNKCKLVIEENDILDCISLKSATEHLVEQHNELSVKSNSSTPSPLPALGTFFLSSRELKRQIDMACSYDLDNSEDDSNLTNFYFKQFNELVYKQQTPFTTNIDTITSIRNSVLEENHSLTSENDLEMECEHFGYLLHNYSIVDNTMGVDKAIGDAAPIVVSALYQNDIDNFEHKSGQPKRNKSCQTVDVKGTTKSMHAKTKHVSKQKFSYFNRNKLHPTLESLDEIQKRNKRGIIRDK